LVFLTIVGYSRDDKYELSFPDARKFDGLERLHKGDQPEFE
jgi:hypothetical protein